jgi:ABC-type phosphate transport system substrate-binding protein
MSAFKQKLARIGATAGVLAAATAAFMVVGGASASSAFAVTCVGSGGSVMKGQGSTLQREAQEKWIAGYEGTCPKASHTSFTYTGTGSGAALKAFGYTGSAIETEYAYVGTDEAPTPGQITTATEKSNKVAPVIIPVAQTSIAVDVNIPAACALSSGKGLTYEELNSLFAGKTTKWSALSNVASKTSCETKEHEEETAKPGSALITRVVRLDGSGTTYQFKNYLSALETGQGATGPGSAPIATGGTCATRTWAELRPNNGSGPPNTLWPENGVCSRTGLSTVVKKEGGGGVAAYVAANANTIGYSALPDTKKNGASFALLQNRKTPSVTYASPVKSVEKEGKQVETTEANCASHTYTRPSGWETGLEVNWSETFGAVPTIGGSFYPLCTLTYDLSWNGYAATGLTGYSNETAEGVKAYLGTYALATPGQTVLSEHYYQPLTAEVQEAAEKAVAKIK